MIRWLLVLTAMAMAALGLAENLCTNPGAEAVEGKLPGFAMYTGAGMATVTPTTAERHSGRGSACLDVTGWWRAKGAADTPANRSVNMALVLAENDGFSAKGGMTARPGELIAVSFWYKGTLPEATVRGAGWPNASGKQADRMVLPLNELIAPTAEWRPFGATFRVPEQCGVFSVQINASGSEKAGYKLGRLFVDDVRITRKVWPDGEMRAVWYWGPEERKDAAKSQAETNATLDRLKATGFNTLLVEADSLLLVAVDRPELQSKVEGASFDCFGMVVKAAAARGLQVHLWYPPWTYKRNYNSIEPLEHPEWRAVNADSKPDDDSICFVRADCRQYQLDLLRTVLMRYPDLAGIHIEEPGHPTCHCAYCAKLAREWLGVDILADPTAAEPSLRNLAAFMNGDFFARLRQMVNQIRPEVWISANGSAGANPDWNIARDWPTWSKRGYIDFYVPQIYTEDVAQFGRLLTETQGVLGQGSMVAGMAASWSGIYPRRQDPAHLAAEIKAARAAGARGVCVFCVKHFDDPTWKALGEAIKQ